MHVLFGMGDIVGYCFQYRGVIDYSSLAEGRHFVDNSWTCR